MSKKKIIIIIAIIIIIGVAAWLILRKPKDKAPDAAASVSSNIDLSVFPLKMGSRGKEVESVQKYLNSKYNASLQVDGIWGALTDAAVQGYLKRDNVSSDIYIKWGLGN
jgi:peptidoglycan hydrolase-like protein with peptidoglycan-binding domain